MTDAQIIDLFFERSEQAIEELAKKHGGAVGRIAYICGWGSAINIEDVQRIALGGLVLWDANN